MPLIALEILEKKIKELILIINKLKEENLLLKNELNSLRSLNSQNSMPKETQEEIILLKEQLSRYKTERSVIFSKLSNALKNLDLITGGDENG